MRWGSAESSSLRGHFRGGTRLELVQDQIVFFAVQTNRRKQAFSPWPGHAGPTRQRCGRGFGDSTPATHHRSILGQYGLEARAIDFTVLILDNSEVVGLEAPKGRQKPRVFGVRPAPPSPVYVQSSFRRCDSLSGFLSETQTHSGRFILGANPLKHSATIPDTTTETAEAISPRSSQSCLASFPRLPYRIF